MLLAITRAVSRSIIHCELTHLARTPIDVERARRQHAEYEAALRRLGAAVISLPEEPTLPDAVFVEDTALVLDECAVILRPGAESRRPEAESIARLLSRYRKLYNVQAPARVDGGDLLQIGRDLYLGLSTRSEATAAEQLRTMLEPLGYRIHEVEVTGCLHLKSAATRVQEDTLLINPAWIDKRGFHGVKTIEIDASEPYAANAVLLGNSVIYPTAFPKTYRRLVSAGLEVVTVAADELAKAEGAVTCCSLIFQI